MKRFKEKAFAKGANREEIKLCEKLGLSLEEFITISLSAMQKIHEDLGL
jgi:predicted hydrolase (HD superfamily)